MSGSAGAEAMEGSRFSGCDEWLAAVDRALAHAGSQQILASIAIDREAVLAVARCEVSCASEAGVCALSHAAIALSTGLPRPVVLRARLALIELGLADLAVGPGIGGEVSRELRHF